MHLTNLQLVLILFVLSNLSAYLLGRRHGVRRERRKHSLDGMGYGGRQ